MSLSKLSDRQIASVIGRYRLQGKSEGGPYSLAQLILEQRRRATSAFPVFEVARAILELSSKSPDRFLTYNQIWTRFRPNEPWKGHASQRPVKDALYQVVGYCAANGLPIITVLVVRTGSRKLSKQAVDNIFNECRELGLDVGIDPNEFVKRETERTLQMSLDKLPRKWNQ